MSKMGEEFNLRQRILTENGKKRLRVSDVVIFLNEENRLIELYARKTITWNEFMDSRMKMIK